MEIGIDVLTNEPVRIDAKRHILVEGSSGVGKSTLLINLFLAHLNQGYGAMFEDPHGDAVDVIAERIDRKWSRDLIWIDPKAKRVPPLNPLYYADPEELELGKESFYTTIKSLAGTAWGDESGRVIANAIDAVCEAFHTPSPVDVFRFMADDKFRERLLRKSANPMLQMFAEQYDKKLRDSEQMSKFSPPLNKVAKLMRPFLLPMIGQPDSVDFLELMNTSKIILCRLSKGAIGEESAQILGSLIVSMVSIAALKRERQRDRSPFMVVVDEAHNFTHGGRFSSLLAEARKYGVCLCVGTQGLYQLNFAKDVLANCATQIIFNSSGEDAALMEKNWGRDDLVHQITGLPRYHCYVRTFNERNNPEVRKVRLYPLAERREGDMSRTRLIQASLERWGRDKRTVTEEIMKRLSA